MRRSARRIQREPGVNVVLSLQSPLLLYCTQEPGIHMGMGSQIISFCAQDTEVQVHRAKRVLGFKLVYL